MAFIINKPIIHGSGEHSALLAKAERIPTHGADPAIMAAVADYSKSNSPDVIDWQLTMGRIEIDKKKKKKPIIPKKNRRTKTLNQRKVDKSNEDKDKAIKTLKTNAKTLRGHTIIPSLAIPHQIGERRILEDLYEEGTIKESYTSKEQEKLVFWEDGAIMVLPKELKKLEKLDITKRYKDKQIIEKIK